MRLCRKPSGHLSPHAEVGFVASDISSDVLKPGLPRARLMSPELRARTVSQVTECLPSMAEGQGSAPNTDTRRGWEKKNPAKIWLDGLAMPPRALEGRTNNVCSNTWRILFLCLPHLTPNKDPDPKAKEIKKKWMSVKDPPSTESEIRERKFDQLRFPFCLLFQKSLRLM